MKERAAKPFWDTLEALERRAQQNFLSYLAALAFRLKMLCALQDRASSWSLGKRVRSHVSARQGQLTNLDVPHMDLIAVAGPYNVHLSMPLHSTQKWAADVGRDGQDQKEVPGGIHQS